MRKTFACIIFKTSECLYEIHDSIVPERMSNAEDREYLADFQNG